MKTLTNNIENADKSGIQSSLEGLNVLAKFNDLRTKNLIFKKSAGSDSEEEEMVHVVYHVGSPPRKKLCMAMND